MPKKAPEADRSTTQRLIPLSQAAQEYEIPEKRLRLATSADAPLNLKHCKIGRTKLVRREDLEAWIEAQG